MATLCAAGRRLPRRGNGCRRARGRSADRPVRLKRADGSVPRRPSRSNEVAFMVHMVGACAVTSSGADALRHRDLGAGAGFRKPRSSGRWPRGPRSTPRPVARWTVTRRPPRSTRSRASRGTPPPSCRRCRMTAARTASGPGDGLRRRAAARATVDAGAADPWRARSLDPHRCQPADLGRCLPDRPQQLTAVRLPGTGHFPTMARGAEGEEAAPISPDYEALLPLASAAYTDSLTDSLTGDSIITWQGASSALRLPARVVSEATGASPRTVERWRAGMGPRRTGAG